MATFGIFRRFRRDFGSLWCCVASDNDHPLWYFSCCFTYPCDVGDCFHFCVPQAEIEASGKEGGQVLVAYGSSGLKELWFGDDVTKFLKEFTDMEPCPGAKPVKVLHVRAAASCCILGGNRRCDRCRGAVSLCLPMRRWTALPCNRHVERCPHQKWYHPSASTTKVRFSLPRVAGR